MPSLKQRGKNSLEMTTEEGKNRKKTNAYSPKSFFTDSKKGDRMPQSGGLKKGDL
jgi:hypothetical protein